MTDKGSPFATDPALAAAAYVQAWENVRHIRNERIWFTNAYSAIVAGSLAALLRDSGGVTRTSTTAGLLILVLFSFASLMSSIRLVAELRSSIANVQRAVDGNGMGRIVGAIEPLSGLGARWPMQMAVSDLLQPFDGSARGLVCRPAPAVAGCDGKSVLAPAVPSPRSSPLREIVSSAARQLKLYGLT